MEQLQQLGYTQRNIARNIEKTQYKLNNAETAVDFNKSCILNGLLPKYTLCRSANSRRETMEERRKYLQEELVRK